MTSPKPAKAPNVKYVTSYQTQPLHVRQYIDTAFSTPKADDVPTMQKSLLILIGMVARLIVVLVGKNRINAAELKYIVEGQWNAYEVWADWSPAIELEEGPEIPIITPR